MPDSTHLNSIMTELAHTSLSIFLLLLYLPKKRQSSSRKFHKKAIKSLLILKKSNRVPISGKSISPAIPASIPPAISIPGHRRTPWRCLETLQRAMGRRQPLPLPRGRRDPAQAAPPRAAPSSPAPASTTVREVVLWPERHRRTP